jgi:hypothetical protein
MEGLAYGYGPLPDPKGLQGDDHQKSSLHHHRVGKATRTKFGIGKRKDTKRAIITLKSGSIDIFTNVG